MYKKILFGLGNPGANYQGTRHNFGSYVLQIWEQQVSDEEKQQSTILKPQINMNRLGEQLRDLLKNKNISLENVLILHDDMELPLGEALLVQGGSAKGHNGVRSIQQELGTIDIPRLRLGIGRPPVGVDPSNYVLSKFTAEEQPHLENMAKEASRIITEFINKLE